MAAVFQHIDIDISYLSEPEQDQIRAVVKRDELLRQQLLEHIELVSSFVSHNDRYHLMILFIHRHQ